MNIVDLFSGAGGLTEGFRGDDFNILAHIEKEKAASKTLLVRDAFYYLRGHNRLSIYRSFLERKISYEELIAQVPVKLVKKMINKEIGDETISSLFDSITKILPPKESVSGIIGGPPCQAYSIIGRAQNKHKLATDGRIYLYRYYIEFLKKYNPKFFVFENVKGLLSFKDTHGHPLLKMMTSEFNEAGYSLKIEVVNASEYGVSQKRERVIIFGSTDPELPKRFFEQLQKLKEDPLTVDQLFNDLPKLHSGEEKNRYRNVKDVPPIVKNYYRGENMPLTWNVARPHLDRDLRIYRKAAIEKKHGRNLTYDQVNPQDRTHKNIKDFKDRYKVVDGMGVSHTVVAHISKDGHHYIHPDIEQNRSLTVREAARIQSFPDDFYFEESRTSAFTQIGNAVPPLLSHKIAQAVKNLKIN